MGLKEVEGAEGLVEMTARWAEQELDGVGLWIGCGVRWSR
jgi:hypothetical protein